MVAYGGSASREEIGAGGFEADMTRGKSVVPGPQPPNESKCREYWSAPAHVDG